MSLGKHSGLATLRGLHGLVNEALCVTTICPEAPYAALNTAGYTTADKAACGRGHDLLQPILHGCLLRFLSGHALQHVLVDLFFQRGLVTHDDCVTHGIEQCGYHFFAGLYTALRKHIFEPHFGAIGSTGVDKFFHTQGFAETFCKAGPQAHSQSLSGVCTSEHCLFKAALCAHTEVGYCRTHTAKNIGVNDILKNTDTKLIQITGSHFTEDGAYCFERSIQLPRLIVPLFRNGCGHSIASVSESQGVLLSHSASGCILGCVVEVVGKAEGSSSYSAKCGPQFVVFSPLAGLALLFGRLLGIIGIVDLFAIFVSLFPVLAVEVVEGISLLLRPIVLRLTPCSIVSELSNGILRKLHTACAKGHVVIVLALILGLLLSLCLSGSHVEYLAAFFSHDIEVFPVGDIVKAGVFRKAQIVIGIGCLLLCLVPCGLQLCKPVLVCGLAVEVHAVFPIAVTESLVSGLRVLGFGVGILTGLEQLVIPILGCAAVGLNAALPVDGIFQRAECFLADAQRCGTPLGIKIVSPTEVAVIGIVHIIDAVHGIKEATISGDVQIIAVGSEVGIDIAQPLSHLVELLGVLVKHLLRVFVAQQF